MRPHFTAEIASKLSRRRFSRDAIDSAVRRLEEAGYLDDLEAARGFARERAARSHWGPRRLRAELSRRGVSSEVVDRVVGERFAEGEAAAVRAAASGWARRGGHDRDSLARHLDRRGFSKGAIVEILAEFAPATESEDEEC